MIKLLKLLVFGHVHSWETVDEDRLTDDFGSVGRRYLMRCSKCGKLKVFDTI